MRALKKFLKIEIEENLRKEEAYTNKFFAKDLSLDYNKILDEMKSSDYINLLKVFDKYFGDYVTLQTSNAEYLDAFESMWTVK